MAHKSCGSCGAAFDGEAAADGLAIHVASFHPAAPAEAGSPAPAGSTGSTRKAPPGAEARAKLVARAVELGIPAKGKSADLEAAIAEAEAAGSATPSQPEA